MLYRLQNIAEKTGDHFLQAFKDIPKNTSTLDASGNDLRNKKAGVLAQAFQLITKSVTAINFSHNGLGNDLQGDGFLASWFGGNKKNDISNALKHLPKSVTALDLSNNELGNKSADKLIKLIKALGNNLTHLNLARNNLGHFTTDELIAIFKAMPKSLKMLDLRGTGLETKPANELANILAQLPVTVTIYLPMRHIPKITDTNYALNKFLGQVNTDINELNGLIDQYNLVTDKPGQIAALQAIDRRKQQMDNKYSDDQISLCANYRKEIHHNLFQELQKQFANLGINSLHNIAKLDDTGKTNFASAPDTLPELIANMAPNTATTLLEILAAGASFDKIALQNLYNPTEPGFADYQTFRAKNSIEFLGGGNSKNFKIIPKDGSEPFVLKVDNRMGLPKGAEAHLREHSLNDVLTPVAVERQVTGSVNGETVTRTLLVTAFCSGGDLQKHSEKSVDTQTRLTSAISIYTQMSDILTRITRDGCGFPDMKNSNWLIEQDGTVRMADTKALVFIESDGRLDTQKNLDRWYGFITTKYINPPEFDTLSAFSADKMHAIMLGKNLYHYLTQCSLHDLYQKHNGAIYNFNYPVFKTPEGAQLASLIKGLIKENPADRMSPSEALVKLQKLQAIHSTAECHTILMDIRNNADSKDLILSKFCMQMEEKITKAGTKDELAIIKKELDAVHKDPAIKSVQGIIKSFRDNEAWYTIGMSAKADRINAAMIKVPLAERSNVMTSKSEEAKAVRMALASHRHLGKRGDVYLDKTTGEVDEKRAARSFHFFKDQMKPAVVENNLKPTTPTF